MKQVSVGSLVHYVLPDGSNSGQIRPGMVVRVLHGIEDGTHPGMSNLGILCEPADYGFGPNNLVVYASGVDYDVSGQPGTWHWPPVVADI